jgi:wyosine [tRNA(Phe)-imidazoG37] synthetase (radical SAM superfamily)
MALEALPLIFGPVPSRRLGRSLGVGNVTRKACSYSCVYCQVGRTEQREIQPRTFHPPDVLIAAVEERLQRLRCRGEGVDFLTFVAEGEPTLDAQLAGAIEGLRCFGLPVAVISNASLLRREEVRRALALADWVSLKVDAADEATWRKVNRPHPDLDLRALVDGMLEFAAEYRGTLATETLLVQGLNDGDACVESTVALIARLRPAIAYVALPTRPPAEPWVRPATAEAVNRCYQRCAAVVPRVELLTEFEGLGFGSTAGPAEDLLANAAVHPMREDAALALLARGGADRSVLDRLVAEARLHPVSWAGHTFFVRHTGAAEASKGCSPSK